MIHAAVHARLIQAARARTTVTYGELGRLADLAADRPDDMKILGLLLDTIADHESGEGRPLLTAVAVEDESAAPGARFFRHARRRGDQEVDDGALLAAERARGYEHWSR
jgi:hypothetical protein